MQTAVAVPVGILAAICVCMFVFMFWWFPRHYQKGIKMDMAEHAAVRREMEEAAAQRATDGIPEPPPAYASDGKPLPPRGYVAPVTPY